MESGLYVVGTPIGNLGDVTRRAAETLDRVDTVYAEDTRRTGRLLEALEADAGLRSLHEHNEARRRGEILDRLRAGDRLAVVSDAGTPGVSDPGRRVVRGALEAGLRVVPVPGASAVTAALSVSGLPADRFAFLGFPPRSGTEREAWMERLGRLDLTSVVFASPNRLGDLLAEWEDRGLGERACVLCRELTKMHEEVRGATVSELREHTAGEVRGEVTLVLEGAGDGGRPVPRDAARTAARALAAAGWSTRDVTGHLQRAYGMPRNAAYDLALDASGAGT
jgi:16S rRNA (cytidine1402-2'-O)-methyltransferase